MQRCRRVVRNDRLWENRYRGPRQIKSIRGLEKAIAAAGNPLPLSRVEATTDSRRAEADFECLGSKNDTSLALRNLQELVWTVHPHNMPTGSDRFSPTRSLGWHTHMWACQPWVAAPKESLGRCAHMWVWEPWVAAPIGG